MTMIRIFVATCLLLITGLVMPSTAEACKCIQPNVVRNTSQASDVFRGKVKKKKTFGMTRYFKFVVKRTYKGCYQAGDVVYLRSPVSSAPCGKNLSVGSRYLITGDAGTTAAGNLIVDFDICGFNVEFNTTTPAEREYLNNRYVDCAGGFQGCADGGPVVSCLIDPCTNAPACATGTCVANYCGGCNVEFYDASRDATCVNDWTVTPP
jgi:hypothetical protein